MALVPAKCTECGAAIEVDADQASGVCEHCGTSFITEKVITNYITNVTNIDKSVNIYLGEASKNTKTYLKEAQAHFELGEYVEAVICCDNALKTDVANYSNYFVCAEFLGEMYIKMLEESPYVPIILDESYKDYEYRYLKQNKVIENYQKAIKLCKDKTQKEAMEHALVDFGNKANKLILNGTITRLESRLKNAYKTSDVNEVQEKVKSSRYKVKTIEDLQTQNKLNIKHNDLLRLVEEGNLTEVEALKQENDFILQTNQQKLEELEKRTEEKARKQKEYEEYMKIYKAKGLTYKVISFLMSVALIACMCIPVTRKFIFGHWYTIVGFIGYLFVLFIVWAFSLEPADPSKDPLHIKLNKTFDKQEYITNLETRPRISTAEYVSKDDINYNINRCTQMLKELYLVRQECEENKLFYASVCVMKYDKEVDNIFIYADHIESEKKKK